MGRNSGGLRGSGSGGGLRGGYGTSGKNALTPAQITQKMKKGEWVNTDSVPFLATQKVGKLKDTLDNIGYDKLDDAAATILGVVKDNSKGFQKDIATKALDYMDKHSSGYMGGKYKVASPHMSDKQKWSVAFEFKRITDNFYKGKF